MTLETARRAIKTCVWAAAALALVGCATTRQAAEDDLAPADEDSRSGLYASTYRPLPRQDMLIVDATILDGVGNRIDNGDILVREGKIVAVGRDLDRPDGVRVIDAEGRWITPGLIDAHSHFGVFPTPYPEHGFDVNEATDPNSAHVWAEHGVATGDPSFSRGLAGGLTTLHVLPGSANLFGGRGVVLKNIPSRTMQAMKYPGAPHSLKMACGENPKRYYGSKGRFPSTSMGNVAGFRQAWIEARDYMQKQDGHHGKDKPLTRNLKLETLADALRGDILVHIHCYRADEMAVMLDVAAEFGYKVQAFHHATEAYKIADLLAEKNVCAAMWPDWWGFKEESFDAIRENIAFVDAAGGCAILHSDSLTTSQRLNHDLAKALAAGRRSGLDISKADAMRWLTINPARAIGLDHEIGSLEAGKNADIVIWSGDPFSVYSQADVVFIDGAVAFERGNPERSPKPDFEVGLPSQGEQP